MRSRFTVQQQENRPHFFRVLIVLTYLESRRKDLMDTTNGEFIIDDIVLGSSQIVGN
jgi:hypothetical protein